MELPFLLTRSLALGLFLCDRLQEGSIRILLEYMDGSLADVIKNRPLPENILSKVTAQVQSLSGPKLASAWTHTTHHPPPPCIDPQRAFLLAQGPAHCT
jgi:hypothetical protein